MAINRWIASFTLRAILFAFFFSGICALSANGVLGAEDQEIFFQDGFNRSDSDSLGGLWTENNENVTETILPTGRKLAPSYIELRDNALTYHYRIPESGYDHCNRPYAFAPLTNSISYPSSFSFEIGAQQDDRVQIHHEVGLMSSVDGFTEIPEGDASYSHYVQKNGVMLLFSRTEGFSRVHFVTYRNGVRIDHTGEIFPPFKFLSGKTYFFKVTFNSADSISFSVSDGENILSRDISIDSLDFSLDQFVITSTQGGVLSSYEDNPGDYILPFDNVLVMEGENISQCSDGIDNDGDGLVDMDDPGCENAEDDNENDNLKNQIALISTPIYKTRSSLCIWQTDYNTPALGDDGLLYANAGLNCAKTGIDDTGFGMTAFNPIDGSVIWGPIIPPGCKGIRHGASIGANGLVYSVGDWNACGNGRLVAFDTTNNGAIKWDHGDCPGPWGNTSPHPRQTPALDETNNSLYFGSTAFCSVDMDSGVNNWHRTGGMRAGHQSIAIDTLHNVGYKTTNNYRSSPQTKIISYSQNGTFLWDMYATGEYDEVGIDSYNAQNEMLIYDVNNNIIQAMDESGNEIWTSSNARNTVTDEDGNMYTAGGLQPVVSSLSSGGTDRWSTELTGYSKAGVDFVTNTGEIYVRADNTIFSLNSETGYPTKIFEADADINVRTVLVPGGDIFLTDVVGNLYRLEADLDYASSVWPVAGYGNRRHTQRMGDILPLTGSGSITKPQCSDGIDNDGDGLVDMDDPGCHTDGDTTNNDSYSLEFDNENSRILSVPYYSQGNTEWCMPTSMSMVFKYYGKNVHSWDIAKEWNWEREAQWWNELEPTYDTIEESFNKYGLMAEKISDATDFSMIKNNIDDGKPVILYLRSVGHAVVAVGYNIVNGNQKVYINDPSDGLMKEFNEDIRGLSPYIAVDLDWNIVANYAGGLSYAITVSGEPDLPKGTVDIDMAGGQGLFFAYEDSPNRRISSYAYGKDQGIGWEFDKQLHPFMLTNRDIVQFDKYVTNHTSNKQEYKLKVDFIDSQFSIDNGGFMGFAQEIKTVDEYYSESNFMSSKNIQDILINSRGEYKIILTLWGGDDFSEKYDEIVFPNIKYNVYAPNPYGYKFINRRVISDNPNTLINEGLTKGSKWTIFKNTFDLTGVDFNTQDRWLSTLSFGKGANCYGMSASSLMEYKYPYNDQLLENQKKDYIFELNNKKFITSSKSWDGSGDIGEKPVLEHIIGFQISQDGIPKELKITGTENVLNTLRTLKMDFFQEKYVLTIHDEGTGHALIPFRFEVVAENQEYKIFVYDPNHPNEVYAVMIKKNWVGEWCWEYDLGWTTWSGPQNWGIFGDDSIKLIPISVIYNDGNRLRLPGTNNTEEANVFSSGDANFLLVDSKGRMAGFKDDSFVNEIPNVELVFPLGALPNEEPKKWQPNFYISNDADLKFVVEKDDTNKEFSFVKFGNGYFVEFEASTGAKDSEIDISQDGTNISVSGQEDKYNLFFNKNMDGVSQVFVATDIPTTPNEVHQYAIDWQALSQNEEGVTIEVDKDGDGEFEHSVEVGSEFSDLVSPETEIAIIGTEGNNSWFKSDVEITLSAQDNEGGVGVKKTEYSLDGGVTWAKYVEPFMITGEGIHEVQHCSIDWFGNKEDVKTIEIKIDKIAPEMEIMPSVDEVGFEILGNDNLTDVTVTQDGDKAYVITDEAGNTLRVEFNKIKEYHNIAILKIKSLQYNDSEVQSVSKNRIHYVWKDKMPKKRWWQWLRNRGERKLILLNQNIELFRHFRINARYNQNKDQTRVFIHEHGKSQRDLFEGLKILELKTNNGRLEYSY